jgi:hypothetical protein
MGQTEANAYHPCLGAFLHLLPAITLALLFCRALRSVILILFRPAVSLSAAVKVDRRFSRA